MKKAFLQGWLDCLCGVYSVVNAHRFLFNASEEQSQELYNNIIRYLSKKRMLKETIIEGMTHTWMGKILYDVVGDTIPIKIGNIKNVLTLAEWWQIATEHMTSGEKRVIILSIDGRSEHYTVVSGINEKALSLFDSSVLSPTKFIRKSACKLKGYKKDDKYVIFPSQCWFLGL